MRVDWEDQILRQMVENSVIPSLRHGSLWTVVYVLRRVECCECMRPILGSLQWLSGELGLSALENTV